MTLLRSPWPPPRVAPKAAWPGTARVRGQASVCSIGTVCTAASARGRAASARWGYRRAGWGHERAGQDHELPSGPAGPTLGSSLVEERILGRTGRAVSVVGLGTWQLGADWGEVGEADALAVLGAAAQAGVTFLDTADVYGDGRSERLIGQFLAANPGLTMTVATKMGRRVPQDPAQYTLANFRAWTDRSRANLGTDTLDLVQLHCPPAPVFSTGAVYDALDTLVAEKRIAAYGVSVETCAEALVAIGRPGTASVQIIVNAFRRKPLDEVLPAAQAAGVGIIARVPLASG